MQDISGNRISIREYKESDFADLIEAVNDTNIADNTSRIPYPYKEKDAHYWLELTKKQYAKDTPSMLPLAISLNGKLIGAVGLDNITPYKAELGYWLSKEHRGNGYVTEAVNLLLSYAFKELKLARVYAKIFDFNKASQAVAQKCGLQYEGTLRKDVVKNGMLLDTKVYAKINPDLE